MIRLFNVYYPTRTLALLLCEALLVSGSFLLATAYLAGPDTYIVLIYENGILKIAGITALTLLLTYYFDLYEPQRISGRWEIYFRLLLVLGVLSFILAALLYLYPEISIAPNVLLVGTSILAIVLVIWRSGYESIIGLTVFRERVYVLGSGERARAVVKTLRARRDAGMEVVDGGSEGAFNGDLERFAADLRAFCEPKTRIDRVIVAMEDRRGSMPVRELLDLRLRGVVIEDASELMERLLGQTAAGRPQSQHPDLHSRFQCEGVASACAAPDFHRCFFRRAGHLPAVHSAHRFGRPSVFAGPHLLPSNACRATWTAFFSA